MKRSKKSIPKKKEKVQPKIGLDALGEELSKIPGHKFDNKSILPEGEAATSQSTSKNLQAKMSTKDAMDLARLKMEAGGAESRRGQVGEMVVAFEVNWLFWSLIPSLNLNLSSKELEIEFLCFGLYVRVRR